MRCLQRLVLSASFVFSLATQPTLLLAFSGDSGRRDLFTRKTRSKRAALSPVRCLRRGKERLAPRSELVGARESTKIDKVQKEASGTNLASCGDVAIPILAHATAVSLKGETKFAAVSLAADTTTPSLDVILIRSSKELYCIYDDSIEDHDR